MSAVMVIPWDEEPSGWGEAVDAEALGDLDGLDDGEVARRLAVLISQISEDLYCAGWMMGIEDQTRQWADVAPIGVDLLPVASARERWLGRATLDALRRCRERLGARWVAWLDAPTPGVWLVTA